MPSKSIFTVGDDSTRLPYDQVIVDITNYVFHYEILPESKAWERAKTALFDALGCVFETLKQSPEAGTIIGPVVPETIVPHGFKLPGTPFQVDPIKGAFDLGTLIRYLDHNDAFPGAEWGHPSDNIGAILPVADWLGRTAHGNDPRCHEDTPMPTMKTLLLAMIKAYEIQGVLQTQNAFNETGLDYTILVRVASTAVVCHLLGCSESETRAGISHAFIDAGPLRQYPNTGHLEGWATGDACMRAVHLALLAKKGQPGAQTALSNSKCGFYAVMMGRKEFQLSRPFGTWVVETNLFRVHATAAPAVEDALVSSKQLQTYTPDTTKEKLEANVRGWFSDERSRDILRLAEIGVKDFMAMGLNEFIDTLTGGGDSEKGSPAKMVNGDAKDSNPAAAVDGAVLAGQLPNGRGKHVLVANTKEPVTADRSSSDFAPNAAKTLGAELPKSVNRSDEALSVLAATDSDEQQSAAPLLERNEAKVVELGNLPRENSLDPYGKTREQDAVYDGETYILAFRTGNRPHPSPHISYGLPFPRVCAKHIAHTFHAKRVYILVSADLSSRTCDLPRLHTAIDEELGEDTVVGIRRGVRPQIYYSDVLKIVREAKEFDTNCLVTLGGGTLTDTAKVVALALANDVTTIDELEGLYFDSPTLRDPFIPGTIPIICIPTTLSAEEYTPFADATNDRTKHKHSFQHLSPGTRLIILDPILTTTTPLRLWLSTGIRAVDHCIESLCSTRASPDDDAIAEKGLRRLLPGLLTTKTHPEDLDARFACQLGVVEAISASLNGVAMGASHGMGHQLETLGVEQGETSCILLPAVCKYNKRVNAEKQQRVLDVLWTEGVVVDAMGKAGLEREKADLGDVLGVVIKQLGMPRSLFEVGVRKEKFAELVAGSLDETCCKTNPTPLKDPQQVLEILEMCYEEPSNHTEAITEKQAPEHRRACLQEEGKNVQSATQNHMHQEEHTFRQFNPDQAKAYAAGRSSYHDNLYKTIFDHHSSTGGAFKTLMDVGCGPGNATRPLAKRFETAYGVDPSPEMINTAKRLGGETASGKPIDFLVGRAEDMGGSNWDKPIEGKVDLLTAGMAAHWFDMAEFWASAAPLVNKGGTVALWTASSLYPHPSTPNAPDVKATFFRLEREYLDPYEAQGNRIARNCYDDLTLPWHVTPPTEGFSPAGFTRLVWDRDGQISVGDHFFLGDQHVTLTQLQKQLGTTSIVTRWRDAHPHLVSTDEDIVAKMIKQAREAIGGEELIVGKSCTLLLFKRD